MIWALFLITILYFMFVYADNAWAARWTWMSCNSAAIVWKLSVYKCYDYDLRTWYYIYWQGISCVK